MRQKFITYAMRIDICFFSFFVRLVAWILFQILTACCALGENPRLHTRCHFCDVVKNDPSEHKDIWNTHTSGSEKPCKKRCHFSEPGFGGEGGREAAVPVCRASSLASSSSFGRPNLIYFWFIDPASNHMLVSKTKQYMSQYELLYSETANASWK